eukprot:5624344-Prymnesium_polylepis.1
MADAGHADRCRSRPLRAIRSGCNTSPHRSNAQPMGEPLAASRDRCAHVDVYRSGVQELDAVA